MDYPLQPTDLQQVGNISPEELALITPGWLHLNDAANFSFEYMSESMKEDLGGASGGDSVQIEERFWISLREETRDNLLRSWEILVNQQEKDRLVTSFVCLQLPDEKPVWYISNSKLYGENSIISMTNALDYLRDFRYRLGKMLDDSHFLRDNLSKYDTLSARERELVRLLAKDHTIAEAAKKLGITEQTAKTHRKNIYRKLQITNLCELIRYAYVYGMF